MRRFPTFRQRVALPWCRTLAPDVPPLAPTTRLSFSGRPYSTALHNEHRATLSTNASSVNPEEVALFSRLSSQWWDERGEFRMLHAMNPARMQFMTQKLMEMRREEDPTADVDETTVLRGLDVLDVGCGGGLLCETLTRLGALTLGIDASAENIGIASMHASADPALNFTHSSPLDSDGSVPSRAYSPRGGLTYMHTAVENLLSGQHMKQFDVVCSMEVLEHVDNPGTFLRNCAALVKPGGHLFLSTIARTPLAYALTILAAEDVLRLVTPGTHTYSKFVNPSELLDFFASASSLGSDRPWISRLFDGVPARTEAETRGIVFVPWRGEWALVPRSAPGAKLWSEGCNYLFWVRRPLLS